MRQSVRDVRVFALDPTKPPVDVPDVREVWIVDGVYCVRQWGGTVYRFPTSLIQFATETPPRPRPTPPR